MSVSTALRLSVAALLLFPCSQRLHSQDRPQTVNSPRLLPAPRHLHVDGQQPVSSFRIEVPGKNAEDEFAAEQLRAFLNARGVSIERDHALPVRLLRDDSPEGKRWLADAHVDPTPEMKAEGYTLVARKTGIAIIADSSAGIFYGVQTLKQMISQENGTTKLWLGVITDWPAMRYRGVDDDLSRGPVPTLAFQKHQLDVFASFKANVYSPYFENTLFYPDTPLASLPGASMSPDDVKELVDYAAKLHITVVPEQEAFGHLHHILHYDQFADLAETPHGNVLAPGQPGTLPLIREWFAQIAKEFPGPFLHIGADETFDLGTGRTKAAVEKEGLGAVYADFLAKIHAELEPLHRRLLFWGDVALNDKAAVARIPKDMIAVPWVYWHEDNYDANILPFKNAGIETWVATGDANWSMMYPLGASALDNIAGFTAAGQRLGSTGELVTVWNDDGEGLFNQDWFGVLFGPVAAWQPAPSQAAPYQHAFGLRFYNDPSGRVDEAERELIALQQTADVDDAIFWLDPWTVEGQAAISKARPTLKSTRLHAERAIALLVQVQQSEPQLTNVDALKAMELGARRIDAMAEKFELSDEMGEAYRKAYAMHTDRKHSTEVRELLASIAGTNGRCDDIRSGYVDMKERYREAWLAENRPYWLGNVMARYDVAIQIWQKRADAFGAIRKQWEQNATMPEPGPLGVPVPERSSTEMQ